MKNIKKQDLPTKICPICSRPFSWRKKWSKDWEQVIYCSDKCKMKKHEAKIYALRLLLNNQLNLLHYWCYNTAAETIYEVR